MDATLNFEFEDHFQGQQRPKLLLFGVSINLDITLNIMKLFMIVHVHLTRVIDK